MALEVQARPPVRPESAAAVAAAAERPSAVEVAEGADRAPMVGQVAFLVAEAGAAALAQLAAPVQAA